MARRSLTPAEVEVIGAELGLTPRETWEWIKKKMRKPGKKIPRPGHGLPSRPELIRWLILGAILYYIWKQETS